MVILRLATSTPSLHTVTVIVTKSEITSYGDEPGAAKHTVTWYSALHGLVTSAGVQVQSS